MFYNINEQRCLELSNEYPDLGYRWTVHVHNFENITTAIPTLFVVSTFDGWGTILWIA